MIAIAQQPNKNTGREKKEYQSDKNKKYLKTKIQMNSSASQKKRDNLKIKLGRSFKNIKDYPQIRYNPKVLTAMVARLLTQPSA